MLVSIYATIAIFVCRSGPLPYPINDATSSYQVFVTVPTDSMAAKYPDFMSFVSVFSAFP